MTITMNPHAKALLIQCLEELADRSFQDRVWVRGDGPEVSSAVELVCQLFDDTGLGDLLESGGVATALGPDADRALRELQGLLDGVPAGLDAASLLRHPAWKAVMRAARDALDAMSAGQGK